MVRPRNIIILPPAEYSSEYDSSADEGLPTAAPPPRWEALATSACAAASSGTGRVTALSLSAATAANGGHFAADCPKPAPCFCCGQLGHWAKDCPEPRVCPPVRPSPPVNTETRWVIFEPPTLKTYRHSCSICGYGTLVVTKRSSRMPRHKCNI